MANWKCTDEQLQLVVRSSLVLDGHYTFLDIDGLDVNWTLVKRTLATGRRGFTALLDKGPRHIRRYAACLAAQTGQQEHLRAALAKLEGGEAQDVCHAAAIGGRVDCLRVAQTFGGKVDAHTLHLAACWGQTHMVAHLLESGMAPTVTAAVKTAANGHQASLELLLRAGCQASTSEVCEAAVRGGHVGCLQLARRLGCPWDSRVTWAAAEEGRAEVLEYLLSNGCLVGNPRRLKDELLRGRQMGCCFAAHRAGVAFKGQDVLMVVAHGDVALFRLPHSWGAPLWALKGGAERILLHRLSRSDVQCADRDQVWAVVRYGQLHGAPAPGSGQGLLAARRESALAVLCCFHRAAREAQGPGPHARLWAAMGAVPTDVLVVILEMAQLELPEAFGRKPL